MLQPIENYILVQKQEDIQLKSGIILSSESLVQAKVIRLSQEVEAKGIHVDMLLYIDSNVGRPYMYEGTSYVLIEYSDVLGIEVY